jgi:hypothetical protein
LPVQKDSLKFGVELLGVPERVMPLKCLSRMMGNYHVRFLGESGSANSWTYPIGGFEKGISVKHKSWVKSKA